MATNFQHRTAALISVLRITEAWVKKARIMNAELSHGWIDRHHFGGQIRRNMQSFGGGQYVELMRIQYEPVIAPGENWFPIIGNIIGTRTINVYRIGEFLSSISDYSFYGARIGQTNPQHQAVAEREITIHQRPLSMLFSQYTVVDLEYRMLFVLRVQPAKSDLIEL